MVRIMHFNDMPEKHARALAHAVSSGSSMPMQLQGMRVKIRKDPQACQVWLAWVLAQMPKVRFLSLCILRKEGLSWVPPLLQLRHLNLEFGLCTEVCMAQVLLLTNLQTLALSETCHDNHIDVLDLRLLPKLQCASLDISCKKLWVGQQCRLHLDMEDGDHIIDGDWSDALASLTSVYWLEQKRNVVVQLLSILAEASNLCYVSLTCDNAGSPRALLTPEGTLLSLTRLYISAKLIFLHLPAGLVLEQLVLASEHELYISCKKIETFLNGISAFSITYKNAQGSFLLDTCTAMAARGKTIMVCTDNCMQRLQKCRRTRVEYKPSGVHIMDEFECPCGCCDDCLMRAGLVHDS